MSFRRLAALIQRETEEEYQAIKAMWASSTPPDDTLLDLLEEQLALISAHFGYLPLVEGVSSDDVGDAPLPTHSIWAHLDDPSDPGITLWFGALPFELAVRFSRKGHLRFSYLPGAVEEWEPDEHIMQVNASLEQVCEVLEQTERSREQGHR